MRSGPPKWGPFYVDPPRPVLPPSALPRGGGRRDTSATVSDEALDVMRSWFDTWNRGDLDAFIDLYQADAEVMVDPMWPEAGPFKGRSAIRRFFEGLKESWDGQDVAVLGELFNAGDKVVSRMDWHVRGRASGVETHLEITNVNTIASGKITRQWHYFDHAEALEAVGPAE
jgi:ketosteroid isomerase-like protein